MTTFTIDGLKQAVLEAGLEVYRVSANEIRIAERVRMHLMDSGVAIQATAVPQVSVTVRSQRSDFPTLPAAEMFQKVRDSLRSSAEERGFHELREIARDITDPVDPAHVLDVWHELTFGKEVSDLATLVSDVTWALQVPKCVNR